MRLYKPREWRREREKPRLLHSRGFEKLLCLSNGMLACPMGKPEKPLANSHSLLRTPPTSSTDKDSKARILGSMSLPLSTCIGPIGTRIPGFRSLASGGGLRACHTHTHKLHIETIPQWGRWRRRAKETSRK